MTHTAELLTELLAALRLADKALANARHHKDCTPVRGCTCGNWDARDAVADVLARVADADQAGATSQRTS